MFTKTVLPLIASPFFEEVENVFTQLEKKSNSIFQNSDISYPFNIYNKTDKNETPIQLVIEIALAGFTKKDIKANIIDDKLIINIKENVKTEDVNYIYQGISKRDNEIAFKLHDSFDESTAKCDYINGLFTIKIPYKEKESINLKIN